MNNNELSKSKAIIKKIKTHYTYFSSILPYLLLLFFIFSFLYRSDLSFNQDLGMHLKLGEIIWKTYQVPKVNLFSYTNPDFPFINHHWLFEVIVYLSSITIGLEALFVIKIILLLFCATVILLLAKRTKSALLFPIAFIFFHLLRERTDLRPEIFSFLFTVVSLYILETFEKKNSKLIYILPLISLLWVNSHIYFPVGIFLQLIFFGDILFQKYVYKKDGVQVTNKLIRLSIVTSTSILLSLINPNFIKGALYPFTVFNNYGVTITENLTIFTLESVNFVNHNFMFFYLSAFIVLSSIYISFWRVKFSLKNIGLSLLGLALAWQSIRGFPYLVLISLPYVLLNCNFKTTNLWTKSINVLVTILLLGESIFYLTGSYYGLTYQANTTSLIFTQDEKPAIDYVLKYNLPQPVFNNFGTGSYLIYRSYPKYKVFIDERPEAYPASFFTDLYIPIQEDYVKFNRENYKVGFKTVIFSITDQNPRAINFLNAITKDPKWKIVFLDQFVIVLVKNEVQQQLYLETINLSKLNTKTYRYSNTVPYTNLSTFLFNMKLYEQAKKFNQKALDINPYNPAAYKIMAYILYYQKSNSGIIQDYLSKSSNAVFW